MADIVREIEQKYEAADDQKLPGLRKVPGVATVVDKGSVALDATYYDTEDRRLAADGITLRRRTGGSDAGWHLKFPVSPGVRDEIHAPLTDDLPRRLTALLRSRIRDAALLPQVRIASDRAAHQLLDADGTLLAEVSVDHVSAHRLGSSGGAEAAWTEVEAELGADQDPAVLKAIGKRLRKAGLTPARTASKLARALTETAPPGGETTWQPHRAVGEHGTAGAAVLEYVTTQADALVTLDPAVRRDLPDSVHQMRVATRRMRSAFKSYRKVLDRAVTDPIGAELKWLAAELGIDRDREVLTDRIRAAVEELPRPLVAGPVRGRIRTWSSARRQGSRRHIIAVLDSRRYLELLAAVDGLLAGPPLRKAAARPAPDVLTKAILDDFGRVAALIETALAEPPGPERSTAMHEARKCAKRARYAAELARPVLGKAAKNFAGDMTTLQELLGDHQDSVVVREALRDIAAQAAAAGESAFTYGVLYGREEARAADRERELPGLWAEVGTPEVRRG
ncbi:CYTH and CHAD domain-containing protein [Streptomyces sp. NPDC051940]|uniref:CYTH and CHAD domain-containing protein n=1 Tax=Streptomyces sp. NPDC051940 TaxID=3155675 RepID=UPI003422CC9E